MISSKLSGFLTLNMLNGILFPTLFFATLMTIFFHLNLHSAAFQLAAQIVIKVFHTFKFSCYNRLDYKGIPASVSDAPTRLLIDVQVRLSTQVGISF
jgi:hypothetical protein